MQQVHGPSYRAGSDDAKSRLEPYRTKCWELEKQLQQIKRICNEDVPSDQKVFAIKNMI